MATVSLNDVLDGIEEESEEFADVTTVVLEPPEVRVETDEDSGDEETADLARLTGSQLVAPAEVIGRDARDEPVPNKRTWSFKKGASMSGLPIFPDGDYSSYTGMMPHELFELFFTSDLLEHVQEQIGLYCAFKGKPDPHVTVQELKVFLGVLILSGYACFPRRRMYWEETPDVGNKLVSNAMRLNRFEKIMEVLHFQDNTKLDPDDRFCKLRGVSNYLEQQFMKHFVPTQNLSHDEALVEYFGRHSCKQHIIQKPIRFGYKIWCLNTPSGYCVAFNFYQGKHGKRNEEMVKQFGKSAATVLELLDKLPPQIAKLPFHICCDNLFTSLDLLAEIQRRGFQGTGTMRGNRLPKANKLTDINAFKKMPKGTMEEVTAASSGSKVAVVRWIDNNVVTAASTAFAATPTGSVKRFSRRDKKKMEVPAPAAILAYNQGMGGTDRQDQNVNKYRVAIRGKKWWWALWTWLIDVTVQNAFDLARKAGSPSADDQLEFRRAIARFYLQHYGTPRSGKGRPRAGDPTATELRFDGRDHVIQRSAKRRVCAYCSGRPTYECGKCNVGLCTGCFAAFHTRQ